MFSYEGTEGFLKGKINNLGYVGFPQKKMGDIKYNKKVEKYFEDIIEEIQPDIIHIFGTEYPHTLAMINVCERLSIIDKVVINIQGLISICAKHYYSGIPNRIINDYTLRDLIKRDNINNQQNKFQQRGKFEIEALKKAKHVIGRTDWDKVCTSQINPTLNYHFCNETLRTEFYKHKWKIEKCEKNSIFISQWNYPDRKSVV